MLVRELEAALFEAFPLNDAEPWDHVGLSVGDPDAAVTGVFVSLDATEPMVRAASDAGCNVLLTHHPVYLKAPQSFVPQVGEGYPAASAAVFAAARLGVSILSYHTNLDRSQQAQGVLPELLGLTAESSLEHLGQSGASGLGSIACVDSIPLQELVGRAAAAFDTDPRVWGKPSAVITRCAFLGGSLGDFGEAALTAGAQAIICGEAGYHVCQDLALRGLSVVLLGHDASEYPFTGILANVAEHAGVERASIVYAKAPRMWWTFRKGGRA